MQVDWKVRHDLLGKLSLELTEKLRELQVLQQRIEYHMQESDRLFQRERGVHRFYRLVHNIELTPDYTGCGNSKQSRTFQKGSLIDASGYNCPLNKIGTVTVYLDEDGDGFLHFPAALLEEVELKDDEVSWDMVVSSR